MRKKNPQRLIERLEDRNLLSATPTTTSSSSLLSLIYSVDGSGNNLANPTWGMAGGDLYRGILAANYGDGVSSMNGANLPSARDISNALGNQTTDIFDPRDLSAFIYAWGQFVDHDLDLTPDGGASAPIAVSPNDPTFGDVSSLPFTRSETDPTTGTSTSNPLDQITAITSILDGSQVYGSDAARAAALRTFKGGQLKTSSGNLLPLNTAGFNNADDGPFPSSDMFLAGDIRANENIELSSLQILFMREHNRQASILEKQHPSWTDEQLYQGARQIVIAEIQSITYNEYLPALLGQGAIKPYTGYKPNVNPGISPEFSEAAFRFGHSQLDDDVEFMKQNGQPFSFTFTLPGGISVPVNTSADIASGETGISLVEAFFDPYVLQQPGVEEAILKYLASDVSQNVDLPMVDSVRNILFGDPGSGAGGQDLFALDIQRGRDVGLPTYNEARVAYGLPAVTSFSQISSDPAVQAQLAALYNNDVNQVELFVGGLAEDHAKGSSVGPTFGAIIANQFQRTRDGDRLWYQNIFSGQQLRTIQNTTLADIIQANTNLQNVQDNVFFFRTNISGTVSAGSPQNNSFGPHGPGQTGLSGLTVQLINADDGTVVSTTTTDGRGNYSFDFQDGLEIGNYQIGLVQTVAGVQKVKLSRTVSVTRGDQFFNGIDFLLTLPGGGGSGGGPGGHGGWGGPGGGNGWQNDLNNWTAMDDTNPFNNS